MKKLLPEHLYIVFKEAYDEYKKSASNTLELYDYYLYKNEKEYYDIVGNKIIVDNKLTHNNYVNKFINFYNKAGKMYDDMNIYNSNISRKLNKQEFVFMDFLKKDLDLYKILFIKLSFYI